MNHRQKHIDFLDHFRGIAVVAVFLFHSLGTACGRNQLPWANWIANFDVSRTFLVLLPFSLGWSGVAIFFVVSGFCIHLNFRRKPDWRNFTLRRFFRIYPPYLFAVLFFSLLIPWSRVGFDLLGVSQLWTHLALVHNFDNHSFFGISPAFWSIAVEAQIYLLYPILVALVARFGWRRSLIYIGVLEVGLRALSNVVLVSTGESPPLWFYGLPFIYWFSWSIGAAVADAYLSGRTLPFFNHSLLAWSAAAIGSAFLKPLASFSFLFFALLTATAIAKLLGRGSRPVPFGRFFAPLRRVGLWSYSIYLLHQPFLVLAPRVATKLSFFGHPQIVVFVLCLCLWFPIMALSAIWYHIFEVPSIAFAKRVTTNAPNRALQRTGVVVTPAVTSLPSSHLDHAAEDLVQKGGSCGNLGTESIETARSVRRMHELAKTAGDMTANEFRI